LIRSSLRLLVAGLSCAILAACSIHGPVRQDVPPRPLRTAIQHFHVEGRIAIIQSGQSNTVRMTWEHTNTVDLIGFSGPLGNQLAELRSDASGAHWKSSNGEAYDAQDANQLIAQLTNLSLPLNYLSHWILGSAGSHATTRLDASGRLEEATDEGWVVHISRYENDDPNALPTLLEVDGKGLRVKLAIEDWQLQQ
jgi:outer membrane lipoprotein LolB